MNEKETIQDIIKSRREMADFWMKRSLGHQRRRFWFMVVPEFMWMFNYCADVYRARYWLAAFDVTTAVFFAWWCWRSWTKLIERARKERRECAAMAREAAEMLKQWRGY